VLAPHLKETVKLLQASLPSSVEIHTDFAPQLPSVHLDPLHVDQVLMNLCINARDAMEGQGTLTVALRTASGAESVCTSCHQPARGDYVELAVSDTGPGIPQPVLDRMFEPFFSTKEVGKGSGMGLAMVHGIVHEYGGHIRVDTGPGQGAAVRVWLPAWHPDTAAARDAATSGSVASVRVSAEKLHGRVLVADDEAPVRELMEDLLGSWGLKVTLAEDGLDAWERCGAEPDGFDLVVLDQTMPRMTGLAAAERLLRDCPGLPVILYTGHSEHIAPERVSAAGVRALVRKPLDIPAFRELIEGLLAPAASR
jgi:CheY-like chemotaxis protein